MRIPFSNKQLMKIASVGAVFVIGNGLIMRWMTQKKFKQSPYFLQAQETVLANRALLDLMGDPLEFGTVDLDNSYNFSTTSEAKFQVSMKGSKTTGMLYLSAVRQANEAGEPSSEISSDSSTGGSGWLLKSLEVTVKDKPHQKLTLVRDQTDELPLSTESLL